MRGLPWIRLDTDVKDHPKSDRLADALDEPRAWTYMVELWLWVANSQPDGDLSAMPDSGIARRAGYAGDPRRFVKALLSSGFLREDRVLSGWQERQSAIVAKFVRDRAKPDGRKSAKSGRQDEIPRGIQEGEARDARGIAATPVGIPHGDVDVDVDENEDQELSSGKPDALPPSIDNIDTSSTGSKSTSHVRSEGGAADLFGGKSAAKPKKPRPRDAGMDLVMARFCELTNEGRPEQEWTDPATRGWTAAEATQYHASRKRWTPERIADLLTNLWADPFNRKQRLHSLLTPSTLEVGERVIAPAATKPTVPDVARPVQTTYVAPPAPTPEAIAANLAFIRANNPFKDAP